jgi:hypothetical protein
VDRVTHPWEKPDHFETIAAAEAAIVAAGYVRDNGRHIWVNGNRTAKVLRDDAREKDKFFIKWA